MTHPDAPLLAFSGSSDDDVADLLRRHRIGLTVEEARKITDFLGRDPTIVEATIWGIQGSEHCSYKSSRRFLSAFPTENPHVILGPGEDSGIVAITDGPPGKRWGLVLSHESHNKPSQVVPFEGAATGIGGVVRDVVCMGARVIAGMDMLRLGDLRSEESRTIAREVARGIAGYGNPLGIPNVGGDTLFDAGFNHQCLVNAIAVGIVREDEIIHSVVPAEAGRVGYDIILVGKPTDRSGFGGASFASATLRKEKREQNTGAVQEPNPFLERHLLASTYALFDWLAASGNLSKVSFKDLGAGGVVCASVEQVADAGCGAEVDLDLVHTSMEDLPPEVIACSETQERFCWICHPDLTEHILHHYNAAWDLPSVAERAGASRIGKVTGDGIYRLRHRGAIVCEAKALDITCGLRYTRPTAPVHADGREPEIVCEGAVIALQGRTWKLGDAFRAMLGHENGCSRWPILRHYDKTVIGNTHTEAGEADAGILLPLQDLESYVLEGTHPGWDLPEADRCTGVALAADGSARYGRIDPYWQGANAAVESMRNVAATGATPRALTDCLNYGNPEKPDQLWALERGVQGIADAARGVAVGGHPVAVISGNVSLYNGRPDGSGIDPSAIVCCVGVLRDAKKAVGMRLQSADSLLLLLGDRKDECGGSLYYDVLERLAGAERDALLGCALPRPDFAEVSAEIRAVTSMIDAGLVRSCHDISDGGLLLALFEMTLPQRRVGGTLGIECALDAMEPSLRSDAALFGETGGFILEVDPRNLPKLRTLAERDGRTLREIGRCLHAPVLRVIRDGAILIEEHLAELRGIHDGGLEY